MMAKPGREQAVIIPAAGQQFYALQRGTHPRSIFLHGFGGDLHTWDLLFAHLSPQLSTLRFDWRGFGKSRCTDPVLFRHSDDLLAMLEALAIPSCDLVGVSMGASIALNFALDHPQQVRNLVLISPGLMAWEWSDHWRQLWASILAKARAGEMMAAKRLWYEHPLFASTRNSQAADSLYDSIMSYSGQHWLHNTEKPELPDMDRLAELNCRTLLLTGGLDMADFKLIASVIEACVTDLERVNFPDQGHLLHLEKPFECASVIQKFLKN